MPDRYLRDDEDFVHTRQGYCCYTLTPVALLYNLYVFPEYRRQGCARRLIQYAINEIRVTGYTGDIEIEACPSEDNISKEQLTKFYQSLGLKCT